MQDTLEISYATNDAYLQGTCRTVGKIKTMHKQLELWVADGTCLG